MNIFKRISSSVLNSWRDFTDYNENKILDTSDTVDSAATNQAVQIDDEDELDFVQRKPLNGAFFLKKRFNNRNGGQKKKATKILDDPRSPTNQFARTPILAETSVFSDILSPFNVNDMLDAVQTAIECKEENTLLADDNGEVDDDQQENNDQIKSNNNEEQAVDALMLLDNLKLTDNVENETNKNEEKLIKIDDICNWNQIEFQDKILTESMIVELSTTLNSAQSKESLSAISEDENQQCKVIGFTMKNKDEQQQNNCQKSSTPKKSLNNKPSQTGQRTPLMSIGNSPLIGKNTNKSNAFQKNTTNNKKRILNQNRRTLPKQPATPMTPLNRPSKTITVFDKENF